MLLRWAFAAALLLVLIVTAVVVWRAIHKPPPPPPAPLVVQTMTVAPRAVPNIIDTSGTVIAQASAEVRPQTNGVLTSVRIRDGQDVRKGQFLFTIDPRPLAAALREARGALERDAALEIDAADTERRYKLLMTQDSIAAKSYATALNTLNALRATVATDRAAVDLAKTSLPYTDVRAPISGRAGAVLVKLGNLATTGSSTALVLINTVSPIEVAFALPHSQVDAVRAPMQGEHTQALPVAALDSVTGRRIEAGALVVQDNAFDQSSGTLAFRARFANTGGALSPSQYVTVRVELSKGEGVIAVPETAFQQGQDGPYVYLLADHKAVVRPLTGKPLSSGGWRPATK